RDFLHFTRGPDRHRELATPLQHDQASRLNRIQATSTRGVRARIRRAAGCATPIGSAGHAGATANPKLTFHLDHSAGADHGADLCFSFYRNLPRGSELNSRNLFSSENGRQSVACKWKFRQWPDDEEVASVPRRRIDQATWLRDNVILGPANRTRPCQGHTRSRCPPPGTSGHHDLEQIRWPRLDPFRIRNSGLVNLKARHSIPFEEAQHLWRNQYVVMPGPSEIPHNRRIQDHR